MNIMDSAGKILNLSLGLEKWLTDRPDSWFPSHLPSREVGSAMDEAQRLLAEGIQKTLKAWEETFSYFASSAQTAEKAKWRSQAKAEANKIRREFQKMKKWSW